MSRNMSKLRLFIEEYDRWFGAKIKKRYDKKSNFSLFEKSNTTLTLTHENVLILQKMGGETMQVLEMKTHRECPESLLFNSLGICRFRPSSGILTNSSIR